MRREEGIMAEFIAKSVCLVGTISLNGPIKEVFPLFSPQGEKLWVPDWNPELLHPPDTVWAEGLIFRTEEEMGEAIWVVTRLDHLAHKVEYHRVEPGRYVARIVVSCSAISDQVTEAATRYEFIGLTESGNAEIALMTQAGYAQKMKRWSEWINEYLGTRRQ
jgi:hypothetical protein